jgi:DNA-binding MltR family transcriptional regulator
MLDELLKRSIEAYLIAHKEVRALTDGFNAPIGTLATRTLMAFALGLISEREYQELILIRKVRNDFAHAIETSFSDQSVAALECPANFVPESMRQTGMRGAWDGTREEAYT